MGWTDLYTVRQEVESNFGQTQGTWLPCTVTKVARSFLHVTRQRPDGSSSTCAVHKSEVRAVEKKSVGEALLPRTAKNKPVPVKEDDAPAWATRWKFGDMVEVRIARNPTHVEEGWVRALVLSVHLPEQVTKGGPWWTVNLFTKGALRVVHEDGRLVFVDPEMVRDLPSKKTADETPAAWLRASLSPPLLAIMEAVESLQCEVDQLKARSGATL